MTDVTGILRARLDSKNYKKLMQLKNERIFTFVADAIQLCNPDKVLVLDDSTSDIELSRIKAIETGEETKLAISGHTCHFDGPHDQGRDREVTKYLVKEGDTLPASLNQIPREEGLAEVRGLLKNTMVGRTMVVRFLSLGPANSIFAIPCVECTDSWYVSHSLDLLYRSGYEQLKSLGPKGEFFATLHSSGRLNERMVSVDTDKKRIYIDYHTDTVYSVNTQYAGNTVGLKKLALRLTIRKSLREGWLTQHMFLMGVTGRNGRKTYLAGAFPSACGKTSTAMLPGESILADDISYFKAINGECRAVNAESGIFGIIQNVNAKDDPLIWDVLTKPGEVIFSNVLINNGTPYWLGMGVEIPTSGINFTGEWTKGKKDKNGQEILPAHKNARYTVALKALRNCDPELDNLDGIVVGGIIYGGRDAHAYPPVQQSFDWIHGMVAYGSALETETTFAIVGQEGVPEINVMSIQDFVSVPICQYVQSNIEFVKKLKKIPLIFGVNYFLRDKHGMFVTGIRDKHVWVKWMELRIHGEAGALRGPTGLLPRYEDLVQLFREVLGKDYQQEDYIKQFTVRVPENIAKMDRAEAFFKKEPYVSSDILNVLSEQRKRLLELQKKFGNRVSPNNFSVET